MKVEEVKVAEAVDTAKKLSRTLMLMSIDLLPSGRFRFNTRDGLEMERRGVALKMLQHEYTHGHALYDELQSLCDESVAYINSFSFVRNNKERFAYTP